MKLSASFSIATLAFLMSMIFAQPVLSATNLINSDGSFSSGKQNFNTYIEGGSVQWNGEANFNITTVSSDAWRVQLQHSVAVTAGVTYSLCFKAKAAGSRNIVVDIDADAPNYNSLIDGAKTVSLTSTYQSFRQTFVPVSTDASARVTFNLAQSNLSVQLDDIALYQGTSCEEPATSSSSAISISSASSAVSPVEGALSCTLGSTSIWYGGFVLNNVRVTNHGSSIISGWKVEVSFDKDISLVSAWDASITASGARIVDVTGINQTANINPGGNISFGFQGSYVGSSINVAGCRVVSPNVASTSSIALSSLRSSSFGSSTNSSTVSNSKSSQASSSLSSRSSSASASSLIISSTASSSKSSQAYNSVSSLPSISSLSSSVSSSAKSSSISSQPSSRVSSSLSSSSTGSLINSSVTSSYSSSLASSSSFSSRSSISASASSRASDPGVATETFTYTSDGKINTVDGPRTDVSDITANTYNTQGLIATTTNALGHVTTYNSYDANGNLLSVTDPNGITTDFTYHERGWLLSSRVKHPATAALDSLTVYTYDAEGQMLSATLPNGAQIFYEYDDARRLKAVRNATDERIEYTLDAAGNRTHQVIKNTGGTITYSVNSTFDELSRVMKIIGNNGQQDQHQYDVNDNRTATIDGRAHTTQQTYDALNRVKKVIDPKLGETQFTYNSQDQIKTVTDARGNTTTYNYDGLGNLISQISPDTGTTTFIYDSAGNRISSTDARGVVVNYSYDALNRLISIQYPSAPVENVAYNYDATTSGNYGVGRLTSIVASATRLDFEYNHRGLITKKYTQAGDALTTIQYRYDLAANLIGITYPSGREVNYQLDSLGRISGISTRLNSSAPIQTLINNVSYLPFGPANSYTYGNNLTHTQTYDRDYRLTATQVGGVMSRGYGYDPVNNITSIVNNLSAANNQSYSYDALNQLITASGGYGNLGYSYDAVGNRLTETRNGSSDSYTYATTNNRLQQIARTSGNRTFTYDAAGNPLQRIADDNSSQTFTFNKANRLETVSVNGSLAASYTYNPLGQRVMKTLANGTKEIYHYDETGQLMAVTNGAGASLREYIYWGNQQIAFIANGATYYIHNDHLNTAQVITNQSQQVVWMANYEPFGKLAASQSNSIEIFSRFPGQYVDPETGLYYNYFRDYDPSIGRYIESDPIGLGGGINTYGYALQNSIVRADPRGLKPGDYFPSLDDAAKDALCIWNPRSITNRVEYAGQFYQNWLTGQYSYTEGSSIGGVDAKDTSNPYTHSVPWFTSQAGIYHTHGWEDPAYSYGVPGSIKERNGNNNFSDTDIRNANATMLPSYLGTPSEGFWVYDPNTSRNERIDSSCTCQN